VCCTHPAMKVGEEEQLAAMDDMAAQAVCGMTATRLEA
jgi:hypothetical protein